MIQSGSARRARQDSARIRLEIARVRLNRNRNRAHAHRLLERDLVIRLDIEALIHSNNSLARRLARPPRLGNSGRIRIARLRAETLVHSKIERTIHESTIASHAAISHSCTVNQLLLRQTYQLARGHRIRALHCACGGKRPAASTLTLVLNRGYRTSSNPINRIRDRLRSGANEGRTAR